MKWDDQHHSRRKTSIKSLRYLVMALAIACFSMELFVFEHVVLDSRSLKTTSSGYSKLLTAIPDEKAAVSKSFEAPASNNKIESPVADERSSSLAKVAPAREKPNLVIHIGPLKTGTTTIQADLTGLDFRGFLKEDGWYYATAEGHLVEEGNKRIPPMGEVSGAQASLAQDMKAILDQLKGRNVVHSFEGWSVDFANNPERYREIYDTLHEEWDITIVSGYRPYFDWVVSLWSQTKKRDKFKFSNPDDWPWLEDDGSHVKIGRLFPNTYDFWMSKLKWFTDSIVDGASPYFKVLTYDMNDPRNPSVAFVCDCLEGASKSCQKLKEQLEENKGKRIENKGSLNPIHYDALGLAAHAKGLIGDQYSRYKIQKAIQQFTEREKNQTAMKDWPMLCPDQGTLDDLWNKTLRLEKRYMKHFWDTNSNREEELRVKFNKKINNRSFCHADVDRMLEESEWGRFFEQFNGSDSSMVE